MSFYFNGKLLKTVEMHKYKSKQQFRVQQTYRFEKFSAWNRYRSKLRQNGIVQHLFFPSNSLSSFTTCTFLVIVIFFCVENTIFNFCLVHSISFLVFLEMPKRFTNEKNKKMQMPNDVDWTCVHFSVAKLLSTFFSYSSVHRFHLFVLRE